MVTKFLDTVSSKITLPLLWNETVFHNVSFSASMSAEFMSDISLVGDSGGVQYSCDVVLLLYDFCDVGSVFSIACSSGLVSFGLSLFSDTNWSELLLLFSRCISLPVGSGNSFLVSLLFVSVLTNSCGAGSIEIMFA